MSSELVIDSFAGGGGASEGIRAALGRDPDIAVNHDRAALAMHRMNHPGTHHVAEDVVTVDARKLCGGRPVGMLWMSPDCKHHSKAKGGKPREKHIRGLAWTVLGWVKRLRKWQRPRVVFLENVEEFADWGPLDHSGRPCPLQRGATFRAYVGAWEALGYTVEHRELRACDFGVPTIRKRLYWIARRDGLPIVWPEPTHSDPKSEAVRSGRLKPWVAAASIIDWSLPCPSIFDTSEEIKARFGIRAIRPLAEATMARIAKGTMRYVVNAARPFVVRTDMTSAYRRNGVNSVDDPMRTFTTAGSHALVMPFVSQAQHGGRNRDAGEPLHTRTASRKDQDAVVAPFVTKFNTGTIGRGLDEPLNTVTAHSSETHGGGASPLGIVTPFLVPRYGERSGQEPRTRSIEEPAPVIVPTGNEGSLAAVHLQHQYSRSVGSAVDDPAPTVAGTAKEAVVAAFLAQHNTGLVGHDPCEPVSTIVDKGCTQGLVAAHLTHLYTSNTAGGEGDPEKPLKTVTAGGNHAGLVAAFLAKYYGAGEPVQAADDPLHTVTAKPRHGLVTVTIAGEPFVIVDIGMRMLTPRERFSAQGFRPDYVIDVGLEEDGTAVPFTLEQQGRFCGNSVCPRMAEILVGPNYRPASAVGSVRRCASAPLFTALEAAE